MNRIAARPADRHPRLSPDAFAHFDDHGRLLTASAAFVLMLEEDYLAEEILALPRTLALRAACGVSDGRKGRQCTRRFMHHGRIYRLEASFAESAVTLKGAALSMTVAEDRGEAGPHRSRRKERRPVHRNLVVRLRPRPWMGS